jgi:hypothetical protein
VFKNLSPFLLRDWIKGFRSMTIVNAKQAIIKASFSLTPIEDKDISSGVSFEALGIDEDELAEILTAIEDLVQKDEGREIDIKGGLETYPSPRSLRDALQKNYGMP